MKSTIILAILLLLCSCATKRTKFSDKNMRIMIDPVGLSMSDYSNLQTALVKTDAWVVLDRARGLAAIKNEQEELHRTSHDRYDRSEKFAHWGKLYGVGAVVVAHSECHNRPNQWNTTELANYCKLYLNLVDANTGEVIVAVNGEDKAEFMTSPEWDDVAEELVEVYPRYFKNVELHEKLLEYKRESEMNSDKMDRRNNR
jgi:hypothetical protein